MKGSYKKTGNAIVDMVAACIFHYESQDRRLKYIRLHPAQWKVFKAYVIQQIPMYDMSDGTIDFDGVDVTEGSTLMIKSMYWEFEKPNLELLN